MEEGVRTEPRSRSPLARVAGWIGIALAALIVVLGIVLVGINSGPGRGFVARQISAYETAGGLRIHVQRIEGSIYGRMTLIGLDVRDPQGSFLTAPAVTIDWRPFAYLRNAVDVRLLYAAEGRLIRVPALRPTPTDPNAPLLPDLDIAVGRLRVDRLVIEPAVTGKRHIVRIAGSADIADGRARIDADAGAIAAPGVAGGDQLTLKLDAVPKDNRLLIDARLDAPAGGLVDSYAGLGKPIVFGIGGQGDWRQWRGKASGTLGGKTLADLDILGRNGSFAVRGKLVPGIALTGPAARLTEPAIDVDLAATLGERKLDLTLEARSSALAVNAAGLLDFGQSRFGNFRLNAALLKPGSIADQVRGRDVRLAVVLDGPIARPVVDYRLTAAAIGFGETGVEGLTASGRATIDTDRIRIPVAAAARRVTGLNPSAGGLLTDLTVNGDFAYSDGRLLSDNLKLRSARIDATAIVIADIARGRYTGALKGRVNDYQVDGLGRISLVTDAELVQGRNGGFGIKGVVRVNTRRLDNATLRDTLGGNAVLTAAFGFDENGVASLRMLRMTAPRFRITDGAGTYRLSDGRIAFRANAQSADYGPIMLIANGTLERPQVRLRAARPGLGVGLRAVEAELSGVAADYALRARGQSDYGPFAADLMVRSGRGPLAIDIHRATFAGIDFSGSLVQTAAGPFAGTLRVAGSGLGGDVRLSAAGRDQRADIDVTASAARIPGTIPITIGSGRVRATAILRPAGPSIDGAFRLADVRQGTLTIATAQGRIAYAGGRGRGAIVARGRSGVPFDIAAQGLFAPDRIVANAKGSANGVAFRLENPAVVTRARGEWRLAPTVVVVPQGTLELTGNYGRVSGVHAVLRNMDMSIVQTVLPGLGLGGKASGTIDATQPAGNAIPTVTARLDITRFTRTAAYVVSAPVDIAMLATLSNAGGDLRALIRRGGAIVGRLHGRLAPIPAGVATATRLMAAPLSGGIRYNGPAEVLWTLTGIAGQQVSGPIAVAADFGGRLDQPSLTGVVRSNGLTYDNQAYGTRIRQIVLDGRFTRSQLDIVSLTGRAGGGTVSARGRIGLDAASGFPMDIAARLDNAQLARSDALGATVTGTMAITSSAAAGGLIKGDLVIPEARYEIIRQGAAEVAELEGVRRKNAPPPAPGQPGAAPSNWRLDIRVRADNRIFVSGMGLESEWQTDMRVSGTTTSPQVMGELKVVRGTYSFAGRRFELSDNSEIRFEGGPVTDPQLSMSATTTVQDVSATIVIGGSAQRPQITFSSTPALPQDEILSRLLFGGSVTSLSPTQAIQLAAALNSLRGSGGGLNPLGKLRSATGVDRLRVLGADKESGRGTALAAGKYISNNIYVEVITDARGFTATQLEIALSKALSVLSQTGSFGGSSVNVRYKKDY